MTVFDTQWWREHGADYATNFKGGPAYDAQEQALVTALQPLQFASVLEVGCGFGRITRVLSRAFPETFYVAGDPSEAMLDAAAVYLAADRPIPLIPLDIGNVPSLPDESYDLVIAAEVLMHRDPEQVIVDVEQIAELAQKYIVNVDWHAPGDGDAAGCYQHDYARLLAPFGRVETIVIPAARQAIFLTHVER